MVTIRTHYPSLGEIIHTIKKMDRKNKDLLYQINCCKKTDLRRIKVTSIVDKLYQNTLTLEKARKLGLQAIDDLCNEEIKLEKMYLKVQHLKNQ